MSQEFFKYIPNLPQLNRTKDGTRKIPYVQKQILNLTGGLFPARLINAPTNLPFSTNSPTTQKWVSAPITQQNKNLGQIYCWHKDGETSKIYPGEKFNVGAEVTKFTRQEYQDIAGDLQWSYEETLYLFQTMERFNLNFIVMFDRYDFPEGQHYYRVNNRLLHSRGIIDHPLHSYKYDAQYQMTRKFQLQKYLLRNKETNDMQKRVIEQIRKLEIIIRKEQRQQISLKKALKLEQVPEDVDSDIDDILTSTKSKNVSVYTRQQYLQKPLPLPPKLNAKMLDVLQGLNIPDKVIANEENQGLFDELRKDILLMFSAQRYIKKKENQKRILDEKKRKVVKGDKEEGEEKRKQGGERQGQGGQGQIQAIQGGGTVVVGDGSKKKLQGR